MLRQLAEHFNEPVLPMSQYCSAFRTWAGCIVELNESAPKGSMEHGSSYYEHLHTILRDITKSNLLSRLLYGGEKLRTRRCPKHDGSWRGISYPDDKCPHGCDATDGNRCGWLPED